MPLHLRAKNQVGLRLTDGLLHLKVVFRNKRLQSIALRGLAQFTCRLTAVTAKTNKLKAELFGGHPGRSQGMGAITKNKDALACEIGGIHRT